MEKVNPLPYQKINLNELAAYQFEALAGTVNAVFTRAGGISPVPWAGLNMGLAVGDLPANVAHNFAGACRALAVSPERTASCHLIHGNRVLAATTENIAELRAQKADALITAEPGLTLTMRFADCTPLLFFDPVHRSVGLAHAGWRGTMQNVVGAVVTAMGTEFGSCPADIRLVIGPSLGPCCYQVQADVFEAAVASFEDPAVLFEEREQGLYFDMWQANARQARRAGLTQVVVSRLCTACHTAEFFSHRAEKGRTGRFGAFLGLPAEEVNG